MRQRRTLHLCLMSIALVAAIGSLRARPAHGQEGLEVRDAAVTVEYGNAVTIEARLMAPIQIKQAKIFIQIDHEKITRSENVPVAADGKINFVFDSARNLLPPFGWVTFWFEAALADGNTYTSAPIEFQYADNRFLWRELTRDEAHIHWYAGDESFGAAALDAASKGLAAIHEVLSFTLDEPLEIYLYSNVTDLAEALARGGESYAGGHANPQLGVVLVIVAPGDSQTLEMGRQIPHEMARVLMTRVFGEKIVQQPAWLVEGLAAIMEAYPNADYRQALEAANESGSLIAFADLCMAFPTDAGGAFLADAQSQSFVSYIRTTYGSAGLSRLMQSYNNGFNCEIGATNALGTSLSQLEARWRETVLGQDMLRTALRNLMPFLLLMTLILIVPIWGAIDLLFRRRTRARRPK